MQRRTTYLGPPPLKYVYSNYATYGFFILCTDAAVGSTLPPSPGVAVYVYVLVVDVVYNQKMDEKNCGKREKESPQFVSD